MRKAIFLDRDGVLNAAIIKDRKPYPPPSLEELIIPSDVFPALKSFKSLGYFLVCVTNQPDVARGKTSQSTVEEINQTLCQKLLIDDIRVCYHDNQDNCACRKPLPGLLLQAAKEHQINLSRSVMIGDRWKDIDAGRAAGCKTIFIDHDYIEKKSLNADFITTSLLFAVTWVKENLQ